MAGSQHGIGRAQGTTGDIQDTPTGGETAPPPGNVPGGAAQTSPGRRADPNADIAGGRSAANANEGLDDATGESTIDPSTPKTRDDLVPERTDIANDITGGSGIPGTSVAGSDDAR